jgi:hypothetical protein
MTISTERRPYIPADYPHLANALDSLNSAQLENYLIAYDREELAKFPSCGKCALEAMYSLEWYTHTRKVLPLLEMQRHDLIESFFEGWRLLVDYDTDPGIPLDPSTRQAIIYDLCIASLSSRGHF